MRLFGDLLKIAFLAMLLYSLARCDHHLENKSGTATNHIRRTTV